MRAAAPWLASCWQGSGYGLLAQEEDPAVEEHSSAAAGASRVCLALRPAISYQLGQPLGDQDEPLGWRTRQAGPRPLGLTAALVLLVLLAPVVLLVGAGLLHGGTARPDAAKLPPERGGPAYRVLAGSACTGLGLSPITDVHSCEEAARDLGLASYPGQISCSDEGCRVRPPSAEEWSAWFGSAIVSQLVENGPSGRAGPRQICLVTHGGGPGEYAVRPDGVSLDRGLGLGHRHAAWPAAAGPAARGGAPQAPSAAPAPPRPTPPPAAPAAADGPRRRPASTAAAHPANASRPTAAPTAAGTPRPPRGGRPAAAATAQPRGGGHRRRRGDPPPVPSAALEDRGGHRGAASLAAAGHEDPSSPAAKAAADAVPASAAATAGVAGAVVMAPPAETTTTTSTTTSTSTSTSTSTTASTTSATSTTTVTVLFDYGGVLKAISYSPVPLKNPGPVLPHDDFMSNETVALWGQQGRGDLRIMKALGANTVRLYGNDPTLDHSDFLSEVEALQLKVIPGISDYPYTQMEKRCQWTDFDCYEQIKENYLGVLRGGFLRGRTATYHSAISAVVLMNEPELKLAGDILPNVFAKAMVSALDAVLDAEREAGVQGPRPSLTVTFSFSVCRFCARFGDVPALGQMWELRNAMRNPMAVGYQPRNDLWKAYEERFVHSVNTENTAEEFFRLFLGQYELEFRKPVFVGEYHAPNRGADLRSDLRAMIRRSANQSSLLVGFSFFEFQVRYDKGGGAAGEMGFGMFGLGDRSVCSLSLSGAPFDAWCLTDVQEASVTISEAVAGAFRGPGLAPPMLC